MNDIESSQKSRKAVTFVTVVVVGYVLTIAAFLIGIVWIAIHFIKKLW